MKLKEVKIKTGADGKPVDRSAKNVCLTESELILVVTLLDLYDKNNDGAQQQEFGEFTYDFLTELEAAFEHKDTIDQRGGQVMAEVCNCDEAAEEHEHCQDCDCVLNWNESENYCCWCVERRAKEDE